MNKIAETLRHHAKVCRDRLAESDPDDYWDLSGRAQMATLEAQALTFDEAAVIVEQTPDDRDAEIARLIAELAAERGEAGPEGWRYLYGTWSRPGATVTHGPGEDGQWCWRWVIYRIGGPILRGGEERGALAAMLAADAAQGGG